MFFYSYWCDSSSSGVVVLILLCSKADRRHILRKKRRTTKISECYIYVCLSNVCIRLKYAAAGMWYTPNDKHWICFFFLFLAMAGCLGLMLEFVVVVWMYEVVKFTFWVHFLLYRFFLFYTHSGWQLLTQSTDCVCLGFVSIFWHKTRLTVSLFLV